MKKIIAVISIVMVQACAFTDAKLDIAHNEDAEFSGPIQDVGPLIFSLPKLNDKRLDQARIGWKKNGYGQNTAEITSLLPVENIVESGISAGLKQNGHSVLNNGKVKISGDVTQFWFDYDVNFWTIEFIGDIKASLTFTNNTNGEIIYEGDYSGSYSEKKAGGLEATWTEILNKTVDKLVEDIMFDEDLSEALDNM
jgi:hypothetical protein